MSGLKVEENDHFIALEEFQKITSRSSVLVSCMRSRIRNISSFAWQLMVKFPEALQEHNDNIQGMKDASCHCMAWYLRFGPVLWSDGPSDNMQSSHWLMTTAAR